MTISKDLFLAILATDSNNRGAGAGINAPGSVILNRHSLGGGLAGFRASLFESRAVAA